MPNQVWHAPNPFSFPQWPHYPQLTVPTDNDIIYQVQPTIISEAKEAESPTSKDDGRKKNRGKKGEYISSLNFKPLIHVYLKLIFAQNRRRTARHNFNRGAIKGFNRFRRRGPGNFFRKDEPETKP